MTEEDRTGYRLPRLTQRSTKDISDMTPADLEEFLDDVREVGRKIYKTQREQEQYIDRIRDEVLDEIAKSIKESKQRKRDKADSVLALDASGNLVSLPVSEYRRSIRIREIIEQNRAMLDQAVPTVSNATQSKQPGVGNADQVPMGSRERSDAEIRGRREAARVEALAESVDQLNVLQRGTNNLLLELRDAVRDLEERTKGKGRNRRENSLLGGMVGAAAGAMGSAAMSKILGAGAMGILGYGLADVLIEGFGSSGKAERPEATGAQLPKAAGEGETEDQVYERLLQLYPESQRESVDIQNDLREEARLMIQQRDRQTSKQQASAPTEPPATNTAKPRISSGSQARITRPPAAPVFGEESTTAAPYGADAGSIGLKPPLSPQQAPNERHILKKGTPVIQAMPNNNNNADLVTRTSATSATLEDSGVTATPRSTQVLEAIPVEPRTPEVAAEPRSVPAPEAKPKSAPIPKATPRSTQVLEAIPVEPRAPEVAAEPRSEPIPGAAPESVQVPEAIPVESRTPEVAATPKSEPAPVPILKDKVELKKAPTEPKLERKDAKLMDKEGPAKENLNEKLFGTDLVLRAKKLTFKGDEIRFLKSAGLFAAPSPGAMPGAPHPGQRGAAPGPSRTQIPPVSGQASPMPGAQGATPEVPPTSQEGAAGAADTADLTFARGVDQRISKGIADKVKKVEDTGGKDVVITSGYRDPQRNAAAGGARNSAHTRANAVDIQFRGNEQDTIKMIESASASGIGGIGVYRPGWLHLDTESKRVWGPDFTARSIPEWAKPALQAHMTGQTAPSSGADASPVPAAAAPAMGSEGGGGGAEGGTSMVPPAVGSGADLMGASTEAEVQDRTPVAAAQPAEGGGSEYTPANPTTDAPNYSHEPSDPGLVEPEDAPERYFRLFHMAA